MERKKPFPHPRRRFDRPNCGEATPGPRLKVPAGLFFAWGVLVVCNYVCALMHAKLILELITHMVVEIQGTAGWGGCETLGELKK